MIGARHGRDQPLGWTLSRVALWARVVRAEDRLPRAQPLRRNSRRTATSNRYRPVSPATAAAPRQARYLFGASRAANTRHASGSFQIGDVAQAVACRTTGEGGNHGPRNTEATFAFVFSRFGSFLEIIGRRFSRCTLGFQPVCLGGPHPSCLTMQLPRVGSFIVNPRASGGCLLIGGAPAAAVFGRLSCRGAPVGWRRSD